MKMTIYKEAKPSDFPRGSDVEKSTFKRTGVWAKILASEWFVPAGLILLSIVPAIGGAIRLTELTSGAEITPENARFFASPLPVVLHIFSVTFYSFLGAFQFASGFRRRRPGWHRAAGRFLALCGLTVALTGLWMTQFYPIPYGGALLYWQRILVASAMALFIVLGLAATRRRSFARHGAWMMRAYALGMGAGTQALTLGVGSLILGGLGDLSNALLHGVGWAINVAVAEWIIRKRLARPRRAAAGAVSRR